MVERYWDLEVTWQRDGHCGDAFVLFFLFFLILFSYDACVQWFPEATGIVLGFFKQRQTKEK